MTATTRRPLRRRRDAGDAASAAGRSVYRVLLQAGAGAAALASIVGLVLTLVTLWPRGDSGGAGGRAKVRVALTRPDVQVTTYARYVREHRQKLLGVPKADRARVGIGVDYRVSIRNAPPDRLYPVRLTLQRSVGGETVPVRNQDDEALDTSGDPETDQTVANAFVVVARPGRYRVRVDVMSATDHRNPVTSAFSPFVDVSRAASAPA